MEFGESKEMKESVLKRKKEGEKRKDSVSKSGEWRAEERQERVS